LTAKLVPRPIWTGDVTLRDSAERLVKFDPLEDQILDRRTAGMAGSNRLSTDGLFTLESLGLRKRPGYSAAST
jgi:hypothetical protein